MRKILNKKNLINVGIAIVIYLVMMFLLKGGYVSRHYKSLLVPIGVNIILAVSLNLIVGFLGELTLGHAGFMSVGAYVGCLIILKLNLPIYIEFPIAILAGGLAAAVFGVIIGVPTLKLKGDYLAIVTLAFGEIIRSVVTNLNITGGAAGLKNIPKYANFTIVFIAAVVSIIIISNLVNSRHGRAICAIRDNVIAAESIGINVVYHKLLAFVIAAFFAGIAGVLYGSNLGILKPSTFDFNKSIEILVIVVLGGMGSIRGSIISATVITLLPEVLRGLEDYRMLIYAVVLIVMMILNTSPKFAEMKATLFSKFKGNKKNGKESGQNAIRG